MVSRATSLLCLYILLISAQPAPWAIPVPEPPMHDSIAHVAPNVPLVPPSVPRIAMLHMQDAVWFFARLGSLTLANKRRYAKRWGYDLVSVTAAGAEGIQKRVACPAAKSEPCFEPDAHFDIDHGRAPTFGKIRLARAACVSRPDYWLLWSDADALILNQSIPLESIIDDAYDLIFAYDWLMLNAGMLLIKCTKWTEDFLAKVYDARKFDKARALDQSALQAHLDALPRSEYQEHVKVIPKHAMNTYLEEIRPGDFFIHMAGKLYEATEKGLTAIANQLDILSRMDDIRDVEAFFNTRFLLNAYSGTCNRTIDPHKKDCPPDDPRRIRLPEPLIAMSTPNRYRHVALRYYFLQHWRDKYDIPNWNVKKKPLPMPTDRYKSEMAELADELLELERRKKSHLGKSDLEKPLPPQSHVDTQPQTVKNDAADDGDDIVNFEAVKQALAHDDDKPKAGDRVNDAKDGGNELNADGVGFTVKLMVFSLFAVAGGCGVLMYRRRKRFIKVQ